VQDGLQEAGQQEKRLFPAELRDDSLGDVKNADHGMTGIKRCCQRFLHGIHRPPPFIWKPSAGACPPSPLSGHQHPRGAQLRDARLVVAQQAG
jgi:hypothetical protein